MFNRLKSKSAQLSVYLLFVCLSALAKAQEIPKGWESYLSRPDILKMPAISENLKNQMEPNMKAAHFSMVAELLSLYPPDTHIYFLARDSEHLYDVARLVTEGTSRAENMHLLNISRANMSDQNMKAYLEENGISEKSLSEGQKVLFVDTGFAGTIPRVISEKFPAIYRSQLKTHLAVSSNPSHPSTRAFLVHLNPSVIESVASRMHGTIITYEHISRYTDRSSEYYHSEGKWHPISQIGQTSDGSVSQEKAIGYMQELKAEWHKPEVRAQFQKEMSHLQFLLKVTQSGSVEEIENLKLQLQENTAETRLLKAQLLDIFDTEKNADYLLQVKPQQLGVELKVSELEAKVAKKIELIKKFPEWTPFLENPVDEIPKLFKNHDWQMIGNLIDANADYEINGILLQNLYRQKTEGLAGEMQKSVIENSDKPRRNQLAFMVFSSEEFKDKKDFLKLLIEKSYTFEMSTIAQYVFSKPFMADQDDLLKMVIEKGGKLGGLSLINYVFSKEHTKDKYQLLSLIVETAEPDIDKQLKNYTLSLKEISTPEREILRKSLDIPEKSERKKYIEAELLNLKKNPAPKAYAPPVRKTWRPGMCKSLFN